MEPLVVIGVSQLLIQRPTISGQIDRCSKAVVGNIPSYLHYFCLRDCIGNIHSGFLG